MLTASIVFLMMLNIVAASGAALFALQISAPERRNGSPPSTALASDDAEITHNTRALEKRRRLLVQHESMPQLGTLPLAKRSARKSWVSFEILRPTELDGG
jgi:hypothetical protein